MNLIEENAQKIADLAHNQLISYGKSRIIVAIVGAPGSGKSSIAEQAVKLLNTSLADQAALLPMDGYHYDDNVLKTLGRFEHKGAQDTFDVYGLQHMLQRLQNNIDDMVAVPVFDRTLEIARAGARLISKQVPIIICEGNYLLLNNKPWKRLKTLFDLTIMLQVSTEELEKRLINRWQHLGLSDKEIRFKVEKNDLPNGLRVLEESAPTDVYLDNELSHCTQ